LADKPAPTLTPRYLRNVDPRELLGPRTLAVFGFGPAAPATLEDPRYLRVNLEPADGAAWYEVWDSASVVKTWQDGAVSAACNDDLSFGWIECVEGDGGIVQAAEDAYRSLLAHVSGSAFPHLLRIWNYMDAITEGDGDDERYRQFCLGRAAEFPLAASRFPAATAIGSKDGKRVLQVYWISAAQAGTPLENPRQTAAWRYPRQYGPSPPTFARAMLAAPSVLMPMMLSGTAAVVGHASLHPGEMDSQVDETLRNFSTLIAVARERRPGLPECIGEGSLLKVYLSDKSAASQLDILLNERLSPDVPRLVLFADVCRTDLALEIDGFHGV
jgi:chorismate lyase/3-hydroxybenzoate synthase